MPDLIALANVLNVAPVALMVAVDEPSGPAAVEVGNENVMPTFAFVEWWSGRLQSGLPGSDGHRWATNMRTFTDWQSWLHARIEANIRWDELRLLGQQSRTAEQPIPADVIHVQVDSALRAERAAEEALRRLPWGEGGPGSIDHVVHWLDRTGVRLGLGWDVLSRLSRSEMEKALEARPVWGPAFGSLTGEAPPTERPE